MTSSYDIVDGNRLDNPTDDTTYVFSPTATMKTFSLAGNSDGDTIAIDGLSSDFRAVFKQNEMTLIGKKNTPSAGVMVKVQLDAAGGTDHIAFLNGTIDVTYTPGASKAWSIGGVNVSKKINLGNPKLNIDIDPSQTYVQEAFDAHGVLDSANIILTETVDYVNIPATNTFDTIYGVVDGEDGGGLWPGDDESTFTAGDLIEGNGNTNLRLVVTETGEDGIDFATVKDVREINFIAGDSGYMWGNAADWSNIGSVNLASGVNNLYIDLDHLEEGTAIGMGAGLEGGIEATIDMSSSIYAYAQLSANSDDAATESSLVVDRAGITADLGSEMHGDAEIKENDVTKNLTVGDIVGTLASGSASDDTFFSVDVSIDDGVSLGGADLTIGNLQLGNTAVQMGDYGQFDLSAENYTFIYSASGDETVTGGDLTAGNVNVTGGKDVDVDVDFDNVISSDWWGDDFGAAIGGDLIVGNVNIAVGADSEVDFSANNEVYAYYTADVTAGNLTVGNVTISGGSDTDISVSISNFASQSSDDGDATVGDLKVGNITLSLADRVSGNDDLDVDIFNGAYADNSGATIVAGDLTVGNIDISIGADVTSNTLSITNEAYAGSSYTVSAEVGNMKLGTISLSLGNDADMNVYVNNYAYGSNNGGEDSTAIGGDLEVGAIDVQLGIDSDIYLSMWNYVSEADDASVGSMKLGGLTVTGDDGAQFYVDAGNGVYSGTGDVEGDTDFGGLKLTSGVSADYDVNYEVYAHNGDITGTVAFGDIDVAMGKNSTFSGSFSVTAENIGAVTMGDVTLSHSGDNYARAGLYVSATAATTDGDVASVTVGDVSLDAGASGSVSFSVDVAAEGKAGLLTIGNVALTASGADADINLWIGDTTSGDLGNDGAVKVGNITLNVTSAVTKDASFNTGFDVSIDTDDQDITIGDIKVTTAVGNDEVADNVGTLVNWLDLDANGGKISVGAIDYSGYKGEKTDATLGADIDVSGFDTVGTITGSALNDTITDNSGANVIYGGLGSDTFEFVSSNTGKTEATVDKVMDWNSSDKIDLGISVTAGIGGNYAEQTFADFAAFIAEAGNMDTDGEDVLVGKIGNNLFIAVDAGVDGDAFDYVIQLVGVSNLSNIDVANFV